MLPQTHDVANAEALIHQADEAVRTGDLDLARRIYAEILEADPASLDAQVGLKYIEHLQSARTGRYQFESTGNTEIDLSLRQENLAKQEQEFALGGASLESLPSSILLEHTTRCNFYCPHCSKGYDPYFATDMSPELTDEVLDALLPTTVWACITGFGEPTIGSRYNHIMQRLVENGVTPHYSTNASTLTIPHIEQLVKVGALIILSIDGASKETFETIRAGGSWEKLQWTLHAIRRLRAIHGGNGQFGITFVAMKTNISELPAMVRMVHEFKLDFLKVHDYHAFGEEYDRNSLRNDPETANHFFEVSEDLAKELGVDLILPPPYSLQSPVAEESTWNKIRNSKRLFPKRNRFPQRCKLPWQFVQIRPDGEITPCCFSLRVMGSLKNQSLGDIWNGFRYRFFRWRIQTFYPPPECRECHVYEGISKGNPGNTIADEGLLLKVAYSLEKRFLNWLAKRKSRKEKPPQPNYYKGKTLKPTVLEER